MSAPQVERTITLRALAENNLQPEKTAEITSEYAAHSDLRPTLPTLGETEYTRRSMPPDFRLTRGEDTPAADDAHTNPEYERPWR